jgi:hypothetical protein
MPSPCTCSSLTRCGDVAERICGCPTVRVGAQAYCVGPPAAKESYLRADEIIRVAKLSGAEVLRSATGGPARWWLL